MNWLRLGVNGFGLVMIVFSVEPFNRKDYLVAIDWLLFAIWFQLQWIGMTIIHVHSANGKSPTEKQS